MRAIYSIRGLPLRRHQCSSSSTAGTQICRVFAPLAHLVGRIECFLPGTLTWISVRRLAICQNGVATGSMANPGYPEAFVKMLIQLLAVTVLILPFFASVFALQPAFLLRGPKQIETIGEAK